MITMKELFEMSNLRPVDTGLPMVVWVSEKRERHKPRIKVSFKKGDKISHENMFSITIEDEPKIIGKNNLSKKEFNQIKKFIKINRETLLKYWNLEISTREMLTNIKTI